MPATQEEINTHIGGVVQFLIKQRKPVTDNAIHDTLMSWYRGTVGDATDPYWSRNANLDLDAAEFIVQNSYNLIV